MDDHEEKQQNIVDIIMQDFQPIDDIQARTREITKMFMLNKKQTKVFKLLTNHYKDEKNGVNKQLIMVVGGIARTGKSHILKAFRKILESFNQGHWILVDLLIGIASNNIDGSTIHSLTN